MGYISVGADPVNFTTAVAFDASRATAEGPPIPEDAIAFLVGRLRDIANHPNEVPKWQGWMDQGFANMRVNRVRPEWAKSVSATQVMNAMPPSQRSTVYARAIKVGFKGPFYTWVAAKWPIPKLAQVNSNDPGRQGDPLARQKAYDSGTVKTVVKNGVVIARDGQITEEGAAYIQQQQAAKEAAAGLLARVPGGIFTVLGVAGLGAFLLLRKRGG
jgi:hypothetical protein